jgi:argininosuccinate synthase
MVNGEVSLKLYKGNVIINSRTSPNSLYSEELVTFEEGTADYDHHDANGFIRLNALRLRVLGAARRKMTLS